MASACSLRDLGTQSTCKSIVFCSANLEMDKASLWRFGFMLPLRIMEGMLPGGVRTLITLHHGLNLKHPVAVKWTSLVAARYVEWNGDSLSVVVASNVKKCYSSVTNSLLGGNWGDSERIETAALPKNLFIRQQLHSQPMAVWIISN